MVGVYYLVGFLEKNKWGDFRESTKGWLNRRLRVVVIECIRNMIYSSLKC